MQSFSDSETEFVLVESETPPSVDGYAIGEPKRIVCADCGHGITVDGPPAEGGDHDQAIEEIPHARDCPQRDVFSEWFVETFVAGDGGTGGAGSDYSSSS